MITTASIEIRKAYDAFLCNVETLIGREIDWDDEIRGFVSMGDDKIAVLTMEEFGFYSSEDVSEGIRAQIAAIDDLIKASGGVNVRSSGGSN